jgi:hypothetical protein
MRSNCINQNRKDSDGTVDNVKSCRAIRRTTCVGRGLVAENRLVNNTGYIYSSLF